MATIQLTEREQLIERILHTPDEQIAVLAGIAETLDNDPTWRDEGISPAELERRNKLDVAAIEATRGEPTKTLEDVLHDLHDGTDEEIRADNERWDRQFAESQGALAKLGDEALAEYHAGMTHRVPRDLSGRDLARLLARLGYAITRQSALAVN